MRYEYEVNLNPPRRSKISYISFDTLLNRHTVTGTSNLILILISGKSKLMISYLLLLKVIQILISKIKMAGLVINLYYLELVKVKKLKMNKIEF